MKINRKKDTRRWLNKYKDGVRPNLEYPDTSIIDAVISVAKKYPEFGKKLYERHTLYNDSLENILNNYVPNGKAVVIAPDDCCGIDTLVHDSEKMYRLYHKGYDDGIKIKSFLDL